MVNNKGKPLWKRLLAKSTALAAAVCMMLLPATAHADMQGIDVSTFQQEIDWQRVAESGVQFAILRVGYRGYTEGAIQEDAYFEQNLEGAIDAGLDVGVYFFSQAIDALHGVAVLRQDIVHEAGAVKAGRRA